MVSISFGKSNFSKAQNSYQMTISLIMMVIMMCAVSSLITMAKMNESSSSKLEPVSVSDEDNLPEIVYGTTAGVVNRMFYEQVRGFMKKIGYPSEKVVLKQYATFGDFVKDTSNSRLPIIAKGWGLDGVVASAKEDAAIREACGPDFLIVTPGIRPPGSGAGDQKRVTTPGAAIRAGADLLVVARPILGAPNRRAAAEAIVAEIAEACEKR